MYKTIITQNVGPVAVSFDIRNGIEPMVRMRFITGRIMVIIHIGLIIRSHTIVTKC